MFYQGSCWKAMRRDVAEFKHHLMYFHTCILYRKLFWLCARRGKQERKMPQYWHSTMCVYTIISYSVTYDSLLFIMSTPVICMRALAVHRFRGLDDNVCSSNITWTTSLGYHLARLIQALWWGKKHAFKSHNSQLTRLYWNKTGYFALFCCNQRDFLFFLPIWVKKYIYIYFSVTLGCFCCIPKWLRKQLQMLYCLWETFGNS